MHSFEAIGTHWSIEADTDIEKIKSRIAQFDKDYSRFRTDSLIWSMRKGGDFILPDDAKPLFDLYQKLYYITDGRMTPLIGEVMEQAGYDKDYSLVEKKLTTPPLWDEAIEYNFPHIKIKKPVLIDIGAIGKGYIIDIVADMITGEYVIDAGGDIRVSGQKIIGLENPHNFNEVVHTVTLQNQSIAGSAGSRRKWGRFHHIIDPFKLASPTDVTATWAIASTALLADALATALFFVEAKELKKHFDFEYYIITE